MAEVVKQFAPVPESVWKARQFVRDRVSGFVRPEQLDAMQFIAGELAANAYEHARTPFEVSVAALGEEVRVAVADTGPAVPALRPAPPEADRGRGLFLVSALADEWGVDSRPDGKAIWCALHTAHGRRGANRRHRSPTTTRSLALRPNTSGA